jgi:hypothetical protein
MTRWRSWPPSSSTTCKRNKNEIVQYDRLLNREIEKARARNAKIKANNRLNGAWNIAHPDETPRPIRDLLLAPRRPQIGWDLAHWIKQLNTVEAKAMSFKQLVAKTNALLRATDDGEQNLDVIYSVAYRLLSSVGGHPSLEVMNGYIEHSERATMVRLTERINSPSFISVIRHTSLMATALVAYRVLGLPGAATPAAVDILKRYESPID